MRYNSAKILWIWEIIIIDEHFFAESAINALRTVYETYAKYSLLKHEEISIALNSHTIITIFTDSLLKFLFGSLYNYIYDD